MKKQNSYIEGLKFGAGILTLFVILFIGAYAIGFHTTNEIIPGAFIGNFSFINGSLGIGTTKPNSILDINGSLRVKEICDGNGNNCKNTSKPDTGCKIALGTEKQTTYSYLTCTSGAGCSITPGHSGCTASASTSFGAGTPIWYTTQYGFTGTDNAGAGCTCYCAKIFVC